MKMYEVTVGALHPVEGFARLGEARAWIKSNPFALALFDACEIRTQNDWSRPVARYANVASGWREVAA